MLDTLLKDLLIKVSVFVKNILFILGSLYFCVQGKFNKTNQIPYFQSLAVFEICY